VLFWHVPDKAARHKSFYEVFGPLVDIRAEILNNYVEELEDQRLLRGAIKGMLRQLDPFSTYIAPLELRELNAQTSGSFEGVGIFLGEHDGVLTVISPIEDSPAFRAEIRAGDQILSIDGKSTKEMALTEAADRITGKPGTKVILKIRRQYNGKVKKITLVRSVIKLHSVKGFRRNTDGTWNYMVDRGNDLAYLRISDFRDTTCSELDEVYYRLQNQQMRGLIIDLRFCPGGLLESAVQVANRFLREGLIVSTRGRKQPEKILKATQDGTYADLPLVVLINQYTASAAEILAGALKDHRRATIVGVRSYGKGSVQSLINLKETGGAIKLTTAYYYLPSGRNIHRRANAKVWGVDPDIEQKITTAEFIAIQKARSQADIVQATMPSSRRVGGSDNVSATTSAPSNIDSQLNLAIEILRKNVASGRQAE